MNYFAIVFKVLNNWYISLAQLTPRLIVGVLVFLFFATTSSYLSRISVRIFRKFFPKSDKQSTFETLAAVFRFLIILMGAFISLEIMGFSGFFMKFLGSLGVAGVIAGVALKDLVSSMFSGMLISIDKAFAVGDYVSIKGISGTVEDIGFLTTKIITDEGKKVYVPNQLIFSAPFINYSASSQRKVFIDLEIPNTEDLEKAKKVILDEIHTFDFADNVDQSEVIFLKQSLGIFYLEARFQMKAGEKIAHIRSEALLRIKKKLDENEIQLATQTQIDSSNTNA